MSIARIHNSIFQYWILNKYNLRAQTILQFTSIEFDLADLFLLEYRLIMLLMKKKPNRNSTVTFFSKKHAKHIKWNCIRIECALVHGLRTVKWPRNRWKPAFFCIFIFYFHYKSDWKKCMLTFLKKNSILKSFKWWNNHLMTRYL